MTDHEAENQPSLAEVLASIRRLTQLENAQPLEQEFQLPAVFRPKSAETPRTPLFSRLTDALRTATDTDTRQNGAPQSVEAPPTSLPPKEYLASLALTPNGAVERPMEFRAPEPADARAPEPEPVDAHRERPRTCPRFHLLLSERLRERSSGDDFHQLLLETTTAKLARAQPGLPNVEARPAPANQSFESIVGPNASKGTIENVMIELLRPMLRTWLTENMTTTVEGLMAAEVSRVVAQQHGHHMTLMAYPPAPAAALPPRRRDPVFGSG